MPVDQRRDGTNYAMPGRVFLNLGGGTFDALTVLPMTGAYGVSVVGR